MNEFKGTPGPWAVEKDIDGKLHVVAGEHEDLAEVGVSRNGFPEADALLIAAAPRLYAALARLTQAAQDADVGYLDAAVAEGWDALELATSNSN